MCLGYNDNRRVRRGVTLAYTGTEGIRPCERGLHASRRALDAVHYAPGPIVCRVRLSGQIIEGADKAVATGRTALWMHDATDLLFEFSCWVAENALLDERRRGHEPDPCSFAAIEARRKFQRGKITKAELSAAWSAAWSAAESAAWSAAESAARSAAWSAAESAAWSAAWRAARSAAWSAAWSAAESAARSAAWSAARSAQNDELEHRLFALHRALGHEAQVTNEVSNPLAKETRKCADCGKARDDVRLRLNLGDKARPLCVPCLSKRTGRKA